jgi:hypothetical protein
VEGRYPAGVYIVLADCWQPGSEAEWNRWYEERFMPGLESLGFVANSRRYENVFSAEGSFRGRPRYLSVHEVSHADMQAALKAIHQREAALITEGGAAARAQLTKVNTLYRRAGPEFRSGRAGPAEVVYCGLVGMMDRSRTVEFDKWYNERHSPDALNAGLFDIGYRYDVVDLHDPLPHLSSPCLSLYESALPLPALQEKLQKFRLAMIEEDPLWVDLLGVWYSGLFRPMKR